MINTFKKIHFILGLLTVLHFVITGILMRVNMFDIDRSEHLVRMMYRSNHIYILFAGLLNLLISFTFYSSRGWSKLTIISSVLVLTATLGLDLAFYTDPVTDLTERYLTKFSLDVCLAGTALHLINLQFFGKRS